MNKHEVRESGVPELQIVTHTWGDWAAWFQVGNELRRHRKCTKPGCGQMDYQYKRVFHGRQGTWTQAT